MAKTTLEKKTPTPKTKKTATTDALEKAGEDVLKKLQTLKLDLQLQADIQWCLGSYKHDRNPVGLIAMLQRAVVVLKEALAAKTKGVTAKLIADLEKAIA